MNGIESPILSYSDPIQFSQVPLNPLDQQRVGLGRNPNPMIARLLARNSYVIKFSLAAQINRAHTPHLVRRVP